MIAIGSLRRGEISIGLSMLRGSVYLPAQDVLWQEYGNVAGLYPPISLKPAQ